jgi:ribulose 1,5-bisphosphate synthetase/thiazole synthase
MPLISRRKFLQASLAAGAGSQLGMWSGLAEAVDAPSGSYDVIIVGGGTAGAIVAAKLRKAAGKNKRILIIEAGGNISAAIGGTDFPPGCRRAAAT